MLSLFTTHKHVHAQGEVFVLAGQEVDREDPANVVDAAGRAVVTFDILAVDGGTPPLTGTAEVRERGMNVHSLTHLPALSSLFR